MSESKKEENGFCGNERRSFSERRREEDLTEELVVVMAFSSVSAARFSCLMLSWTEGERLLRRMEKIRRRMSGCEIVSEKKVVVCWRISAVVDMADGDGGV